MPELPEVETIARGLAGRIEGRWIERIHAARTDIIHGNAGPIERVLIGRRIQRVERCGKHVRIGLASSLAVHVHLGMTGRLTLADRDEPLAVHTHLQIGFRRWRMELRLCDPRRFGGVWVIDASRNGMGVWQGRRLPPVGADPLLLTDAQWAGLLRRRRRIKPLLMDQEPISGLGNIYCDEALHRAGIHPLTPADALDGAAVRRLARTLRRVLGEAIRAGGSSISDYRTADNEPGTFQRRHRVYARAGRPCRTCGTSIERLVVAGRGTFVCPRCQPLTGYPASASR